MYFDSAMLPAVGFSRCVGVEESVESSGVQQSFKALTEALIMESKRKQLVFGHLSNRKSALALVTKKKLASTEILTCVAAFAGI